MKKIAVLSITLIVLVLLLAGCASTEQAAEPKTPVIIGAEGVPQPDWVNSTPRAADVHYETGYAKLSNKANSIKRANADAKEKISQWINTTVETVVVNYTSDMGSGDNRQALEAFESISRQTSNNALMGVTQESLWVDPDNGVWVLLSMPKENTVKAFEAASKEFELNEAAMYAEYKMDGALKMLEETLANQ
ncbi:LPP20 family lipoprotein [Pleomorphochaeta sp. DL1XJH-081]|jgi:hypothetical protein|uniref:LPP20 family lipoprotein n=1 Tax=Pleomorphochaeta sp. DL1XJH-081 TaxID=3409690 RepID=UPI003BB5C83D